MDQATSLLVQYARYHRDTRNIATHFVGVPLIVFAVAVLLARLQTDWAGVPLSADAVAWAGATLWYLRSGQLRLALATSLVIGALVVLAHPFGTASIATWLSVGMGSFAVGWVIQFVGHFWEGRKPAFFDDVRGLLVGPLFVVAEVWFALGGGQTLQAIIQDEVGTPAGAPRPTRQGPSRLISTLLLAGVGLFVAMVAAWATRDTALFSLSPPGSSLPDIRPEQRMDLHFTFFTIWASLVLAAPALGLVWFTARSPRAAQAWQVTWSAALLVFLVHFYWAVGVIFEHDWTRILHTSRVSAPILDTVFAIWWVADVCMVWTLRSDAWWVRAQRAGVHLLAFVLFFMGAAREGELTFSRGLGWSMALVVASVALIWGLGMWMRWQNNTQNPSPPAP